MAEEKKVEISYNGQQLELGFGKINYGQRCRIVDEAVETIVDEGNKPRARLMIGKLERLVMYASIKTIKVGDKTFTYPKESRKHGIPEEFIDEIEDMDEIAKVSEVSQEINPFRKVLSGISISGD